MQKLYALVLLLSAAYMGMAQTTYPPPGCVDSSLICPFCPCILIYAPVCGCDDNDYSNSCFAEVGGGVTDYIGPGTTCADVVTNCLAPARLLEQSFETNGVRLQWYRPIGNGAIAYRVQGRVAGMTAWQNSPVINAPSTEVLIPNAFFSSAEVYEWRVQSSCSPLGVNLAPESAINSFTFPAARQSPVGATASTFSVYPNPARSEITVSHIGDRDQLLRVRLFDQFGRLVSDNRVELVAGWTASQLSVAGLPNGVYMVQLDNGEQTGNYRIAVAH